MKQRLSIDELIVRMLKEDRERRYESAARSWKKMEKLLDQYMKADQNTKRVKRWIVKAS